MNGHTDVKKLTIRGPVERLRGRWPAVTAQDIPRIVEAFAAAADWSLYSLGLYVLRAKCFKENQASYKMLSAHMRPNGEDDTYFYFERKV